MNLSKAEIRRRVLSDLSFPKEKHDSASAEVVKHLSLLLSKASGPVALFRGLASEPNLRELADGLNLDWVFPKIVGDRLEFHRSQWEELIPGPLNTFEPLGSDKTYVPVSSITWALIPGVSFDRQGVRLGRGKGYYDKSLSGFTGNKVGVGFLESIFNQRLPFEGHDLCMDWLVTDRFVMKTLLD